MRRRTIAFFVATATLIVPALSFALPRPTENQTAPETMLTSMRVFANDPVGLETPLLVEGRRYRFEVTLTWKPSGDAANFADAACETTGGGWIKTGKGLIIHTTNYGGGSGPACRFDHKYSLVRTGQGRSEVARISDPSGYGDNTGYLDIVIWQQSVVTYEMPLADITLPGGTVGYTIPTTTVTPGSVPPIVVSPTTIPGVGLPQVGSVNLYHNGNLWCISVSSGSSTIPVGCVFDPGTAVGTPLPDGTVTIGGTPVTPGTEICKNGCTIVPGLPLPPITIPGTTVSAGIPEGSKLRLIMSWTADTTRLWKTFITDRDPNTGQESTAVWAPFHPSDSSWFRSQLEAGGLGLQIRGSIIDPDGQTAASIGPYVIPGMGQILEAAFSSKVLGY